VTDLNLMLVPLSTIQSDDTVYLPFIAAKRRFTSIIRARPAVGRAQANTWLRNKQYTDCKGVMQMIYPSL
jgi:hypothetical protein